MFIERLSENDVREFIENSILESINWHGEQPTVSYKNGVVTIRVNVINQEIVLSDFDAYTKQFTREANQKLDREWKEFMYRVFDKEYKKAYNQNLKKKYEEEMIK